MSFMCALHYLILNDDHHLFIVSFFRQRQLVYEAITITPLILAPKNTQGQHFHTPMTIGV